MPEARVNPELFFNKTTSFRFDKLFITPLAINRSISFSKDWVDPSYFQAKNCTSQQITNKKAFNELVVTFEPRNNQQKPSY